MLPSLLFQEVWKAVSRINSAEDSDLWNNHDSGVPNLDIFTKTGCYRESDLIKIIFFKKAPKDCKICAKQENLRMKEN